MQTAESGLVNQEEVLKRVKQLEEMFVNDPEIMGITHRFGQDWSGDDSIFIEVVLNRTIPDKAVIVRLSRQIRDALLRVVRSEDLGLYSYLNFSSRPENGR